MESTFLDDPTSVPTLSHVINKRMIIACQINCMHWRGSSLSMAIGFIGLICRRTLVARLRAAQPQRRVWDVTKWYIIISLMFRRDDASKSQNQSRSCQSSFQLSFLTRWQAQALFTHWTLWIFPRCLRCRTLIHITRRLSRVPKERNGSWVLMRLDVVVS